MRQPDHDGSRFVPKGAIAFFVAMIIAYVAIWFSMYALLVQRG